MFVFVSVCVFNVWPKTTLLLPVWPRDAKSLDTPGKDGDLNKAGVIGKEEQTELGDVFKVWLLRY